ncbi:MAG: hypothetical protein M1814_001171 [Vezdaea aestivalis]|nr:MAG: hypothetical protein M1814_001171 [Vezdaea aestivalis]
MPQVPIGQLACMTNYTLPSGGDLVAQGLNSVSLVAQQCALFLSTMAIRKLCALSLGALSLVSGQPPMTTSDSPTHTVTINGTATEFRNIFTIPASVNDGAPLIPNVKDPLATDAQKVCPGYRAVNMVTTDVGMTATLQLAGAACNVYGNDISTLNLTVEYQVKDRLHVEIVPASISSSNYTHYILPPEFGVLKPGVENGAAGVSKDSDIAFEYSNNPSFSFSVKRKSTGDTLFSTSGNVLVYEDQFIEFASALPENYNIYGLGDVMTRFKLDNNLTRTFYAADVGDALDANLYGSHPFYLDTRYYETDKASGNMSLVTSSQTDPSKSYKSYSHGVYLRNAHGLEVLTRPKLITWRALGGSLDLYFYAGPSATEVTQSYVKSAAGLPAMQQYWTFGYHQCRWGYANWTQLQEVIDNFARFSIPLETVWLDIDYMNQYRNFDNDEVTFPYAEGQKFLSKLHDSGRHWVPIVDSAIYAPNPENASDAYPVFSEGEKVGAFMKNPDGSIYYGAVWPGYTVFPDWLSKSASNWWAEQVKTWHDLIGFDGIWIDMSEVASFCIGSCGSRNLSMNPVHPPFKLPGEPGNLILEYPEEFNKTNTTEAAAASSALSSQSSVFPPTSAPAPTSYLRPTPTSRKRNINYPPYVINNYNSPDLAVKAASPNATHADGTIEYDVHNLFGTQILNNTYNALLTVFPGKRPFIIGRSTFVGSGTVAGHWGGDNYSKWAYMFFSIPQALSFSLFGIPMFGVDTCGFSGLSSNELCARWMALSAFFPFYRNHNTLTAASQEPFLWSSVTESSINAMRIRYTLLPYLYTLFHSAHTTGSTVMRALAWEFPNEPILAPADRQFLLGPALLITPVLTPGATTVQGVFPGAPATKWYDWYNQTAIAASAGENVTLDSPLTHIPVFIRGGYVLPQQEFALTTREARSSPWSLIVALDAQGAAGGSVYVDDGESLRPSRTLDVRFQAGNGALSAMPRGEWREEMPLANVTVLGVVGKVEEVRFRGERLGGWTFDVGKKLLSVRGLQGKTKGGAWESEWGLSWS